MPHHIRIKPSHARYLPSRCPPPGSTNLKIIARADADYLADPQNAPAALVGGAGVKPLRLPLPNFDKKPNNDGDNVRAPAPRA